MIPVAILGRYARSLSEVAFEQNIEDRVVDDLRMFSEIFSAVPAVCEFFDSPAVPRDEKKNFLDTLMTKHPVTPPTANFMRVLLERNRMRWFEDILGVFLKIINDRKGIVSARIITASPLDQDEVGRIEKRLEKITGKTVTAAAETDGAILGGMVVSIGNTIYDGSIRTRLEEMKRRLTEGPAVV